jgi:thymidylate synthase (FAD)
VKTTVIAQTQITHIPDSLQEEEFFHREDWGNPELTPDIDMLAEVTGRGCYKSWKMPNPKTATNEGYLGNILDQEHYSVLEHGSITFYVEHVSRALLLELERHRHVSFSVESQRYVNTRKYHPDVVVPPAFEEHEGIATMLQAHYEASLDLYDTAYNHLRDTGLSVKESREAARAFLLESTPVDLFFTGNVRALRDVLGKRWSVHADAEIREFAGQILGHLRKVSPNSVQDLPDEPNGD